MRTASILLTAMMAFGATAAQAAPADAVLHELTVNDDADKQVVLVDDGEELSFLDQYFPFSLDVRNPSVEDSKVGIWIGTILPFGFLWAPYVFGDERPGDDFIIDAIVIALLHFVPFLMWLLVIVPVIGWILAPFLAIGLMIYFWANLLYLTPVAIINAYDRSLGAGGGGSKKAPKQPKERKRRRRREAAIELPSMATLDVNAGAVAF